MTTSTNTRTISKRVDVIAAFAAVTDEDTFVWRGLDLLITREGASRTVTFPDADTIFGVLTYDDRLHTIINLVRDLDFLAAAIADDAS